MAQTEQPPALPENPFVPPGTNPLLFEDYAGLNTKPSRPGVPDEDCFWMDGFMPFGKQNARAIWGVGPPIYDITGTGNTVVSFDFGNIGSVPYCFVFRSDGAIIAINLQTSTIATIAPAGTILAPQVGRQGLTQWGSKYIIFAVDQDNGYFIWDGTSFYKPGTLGPIVTLTASGKNYTSQPTFTVIGGAGSGATFNATILNGVITQIQVTNPGSGWVATDNVILALSGGGSDTTATAVPTVDTTVAGIESVAVTAGGSGYSAASSVVFTGGGGAGATAIIQAANGVITGIAITNPGTSYTSAPTVTIHDPASTPGSGFTGVANIAFGQITAITMTNTGTGYITPPSVTVIGDGVGFTGIANIDNTGTVTGVTVVNRGRGYTQAVVELDGGNNAAEGTLQLMPFGEKGSAVETFHSQVWLADGNDLPFTAPGSITDFASTNGGGVQENTNSFQRVAYTKPVQTNGLLYLISDSSIDYISGVTTTVSGTIATTTYTYQNADPEIGTPFPDTIDVFSRNILLANLFGVHVSYGGAVAKVSDDLDGVYATVPFFGSFTPSACKAIHFGIKIWCLLWPIVDPITQTRVNKLLCWNGKKWFATGQDFPLIFVQHQEFQSILTAYGTDGVQIRPLFYQPSTGFKKTIQSKYYAQPGGYELNKTVDRLWALATYYNAGAPTLNVTLDAVDAKNGESSTLPYALNPVSAVPGQVVFDGVAVAQEGAITGITLETFAADMALVSVMISPQPWEYRG